MQIINSRLSRDGGGQKNWKYLYRIKTNQFASIRIRFWQLFIRSDFPTLHAIEIDPMCTTMICSICNCPLTNHSPSSSFSPIFISTYFCICRNDENVSPVLGILSIAEFGTTYALLLPGCTKGTAHPMWILWTCVQATRSISSTFAKETQCHSDQFARQKEAERWAYRRRISINILVICYEKNSI